MQNTLLLILLLSLSNVFSQRKAITDSLRTLLGKPLNDTVRVRTLNDLGGFLIADNLNEEAEKWLIDARELSEKIDYKKGLVVAFNRLGILYTNKNEFVKASEVLKQALNYARIGGNKKDIADVLSNEAIIYTHWSNYATALEKTLEALKLRKELKSTVAIASSNMAIANLYYLEERYEMALDFYEKVLKSEAINEDPFLHARVQYNIGLVHFQLQDYEKALEFFENSLNNSRELNDIKGIALIYSSKAKIYLDQKKYKDALTSVESGLILLEQLKDKRSIAEALSFLGRIHDSLSNPDKAINYYERQLNLSKEIGSKINISKAYNNLASHYSLTKDYKNAYKYYTLYKRSEDSVKLEANSFALSELEAKYETDKKINEIKILKSEQELQNAKNLKEKQLIVIALVFVITIIGIAFLLYNRSQLKKKNQLEKRNFELERSALTLQMNPHFIFNSLGSISGFISENDKEKAVEYLGVFSRLIRHNLEQSREQYVSISNEVLMLHSYLTLQQLRFNYKFNFTIDVEESLDDSLVLPPLFIQPFVENAIMHGVVPKNGKGEINVKFFCEKDDEFVCYIVDNGIGRVESEKRKRQGDTTHKSLATTITKERMEILNTFNKEKIHLYTSDLTDEKNEITGTVVKIVFPNEIE